MTTQELLAYYVNLLILQYLTKPKAVGTIQSTVAGFLMPQVTTQQIAFSGTAVSGSYTLSYGTNTTTALAYNATDSMVQAALRLLPGLGSVTVLALQVTFTGVIPPASALVITGTNLVNAAGQSVTPSVTETDLSLPLAVMNAFNLTGPNVATGVQLDILGKYQNVTRSGLTVLGNITLDDADFLTLIQFAAITNNSGSSLATIAQNLFNVFGTSILVFDYKNMRLSYLINSSIGSQDLIQLLVTQNLIPKPMGVQISIVYAPVIDSFFSFRTYAAPAVNGVPFNTYADFNTSWLWLSYNDAFNIVGISLATEDGDDLAQENGGLIFLG